MQLGRSDWAAWARTWFAPDARRPTGGRKLAVAVIHRDLEGPRAEVELERTTGGQRS